MAAKMERDLISLLESNGVPRAVEDYLRDNKCLTVKLFANWVTELDGTAVFCRGVEPAATDSQQAKIQVAWHNAVSDLERGFKRASGGLIGASNGRAFGPRSLRMLTWSEP